MFQFNPQVGEFIETTIFILSVHIFLLLLLHCLLKNSMFHLIPQFHRKYKNGLTNSPLLFSLKFFSFLRGEIVGNIWYLCGERREGGSGQCGHQFIRNKIFISCCVLLFSGTTISGRLRFFFRK